LPVRGSIDWTTNGNVNEAGCRIEKGDIGTSGNWPYLVDLSGTNIDLDQRALVARDIQATTLMVDINAMGAA